MNEFISKSENDTLDFAFNFAKSLNKNSIIILSGDLGSGKTKYFGLDNEISSPTFNIVNEYNCPNFSLFHFDLYRLADIDEFYAMGGEEYLQNGACIIEWGEMLENILHNYTKITFSRSFENDNYRKLIIEHFEN